MNLNISRSIMELVLCVLTLSGCSRLSGPSDAPTSGTISGTILDGHNGKPLSGVAIASNPASQSVYTETDGVFTMTNCPSGKYALSGMKDGYTSVTRDVVVNAGLVTEASLVLFPANGSITGKVVTREGGASMSGVILKTIPETMTVTTDGNGDFEFNELTPLPYAIVASHAGYQDATVQVIVGPGKSTTARIQMDVVNAVLNLTPGSLLDFSATGTLLQLVVANAAGSGSMLTYTLQVPTDAPWLRVSKNGGQVTNTPDLISCTAVREGMRPGNYNTLLTVTSNAGSRTLDVNLIVSDPEMPQLTLSTHDLDFDSLKNSNPFSILNTGKGTLQYALQGDMKWLTLTPMSGSTIASPVPITVSVSRSGMALGSYSGRITITSNGGSASVGVHMNVTGQVLASPTLRVLSVGETDCGLAWTETPNAETFGNYKVYRAYHAGITEKDAVVAVLNSSTANVVTVQSREGTTEWYKVYAYNKAGVGFGSNEITVTHPAGLKTWTLTLNTISLGYSLTDIHSVDDNHAWACGSDNKTGLILKFNPNSRSWEKEILPAGIMNVGGLDMLGAKQGYAVAVGAINGLRSLLLLKYDGMAWNVYKSKTNDSYATPMSLHAVSDSMVFVSFEIYYTGKVYAVKENDWVDQGINGNSFAFDDSAKGWLCGDSRGAWKYNGYGWSEWGSSEPCKDVSVSPTGKAYSLKAGSSQDSLVIHGVGGLTLKSVALAVDKNGFYAGNLMALDDGHIWISSNNNSLLFYDGSSIREVKVPSASNFNRMWFHSSTAGWALDVNGIYMYK